MKLKDRIEAAAARRVARRLEKLLADPNAQKALLAQMPGLDQMAAMMGAVVPPKPTTLLEDARLLLGKMTLLRVNPQYSTQNFPELEEAIAALQKFCQCTRSAYIPIAEHTRLQ